MINQNSFTNESAQLIDTHHKCVDYDEYENAYGVYGIITGHCYGYYTNEYIAIDVIWEQK